MSQFWKFVDTRFSRYPEKETVRGRKTKMNKKVVVGAVNALCALMLVSCAAKAIKSGAEKVIVTHQPAPKGCKFKGSLIGEQGGFIVGRWTSNRRLALGALNDMKNQAFEMGANYVVLENTAQGNTTTGSFGQTGSLVGGQTDVTHTGNAYMCNASEIGLAE